MVYYHFRPAGNYVGNFVHYFSGKYSTPWGKPLNFDDAYCDAVRHFIIQNALMWCRDFHEDGLRMDAVHSIFDSTTHILLELARNLDEADCGDYVDIKFIDASYSRRRHSD